MASVQEQGENEDFPNGTWWTNYSFWVRDEGIPFVQPEWDSLGLFTIGVYRHFQRIAESDPAGARRFLDDVFPAVERASNFIVDSIDPETGLGAPEFSIWEDSFQYAVFTHVTYASGLVASYRLAQASGRGGDVERWADGARAIRETLLRPFERIDGDTCTGFFLPDEGYVMRGIEPDCTPDRRIDAATDLMWVFGLIDAGDPKMQSHRTAVLNRLSPSPYTQGISRYEDDAFYYTSIYSPGGLYESTVPETVWPQMSMYMALNEAWTGEEDIARARLQWYVSTSAVGFMPPGEGIDWATQQPLVSTAVEPVTGTWYNLGLLNYLGLYDPRIGNLVDDSGSTEGVSSEPGPVSAGDQGG